MATAHKRRPTGGSAIPQQWPRTTTPRPPQSQCFPPRSPRSAAPRSARSPRSLLLAPAIVAPAWATAFRGGEGDAGPDGKADDGAFRREELAPPAAPPAPAPPTGAPEASEPRAALAAARPAVRSPGDRPMIAAAAAVAAREATLPRCGGRPWASLPLSDASLTKDATLGGSRWALPLLCVVATSSSSRPREPACDTFSSSPSASASEPWSHEAKRFFVTHGSNDIMSIEARFSGAGMSM
mmetsp:Transcript_116247/g.335781  ORF Transcript_116247/g.335781 Transcript_116247/m.335781 type:complete len:240 (+) Transcript_116247:101-820(+)